ncbi:MAG: hypothetical protein H6Q66_1022 [Firmicutes bacterium]|nr:hypothetical protein [Bacillota bacterium]
MDTIGHPLEMVIQQLNALQYQYNVVLTRPARGLQPESNSCLYVIRQLISDDGVYHLIAASKMKKIS